MSDDIVVRLQERTETLARGGTINLKRDIKLHAEAADEIERLQAIVKGIAQLQLGPKGYCSDNLTEIVLEARAAMEA